MPVASSPDGHLINAMERPLTCGCTASECDGLTCGSVVSTTAHGHGGDYCNTMKPDSGDCIEMQAASKVYHPSKSSGLGHGCSRKSQAPSKHEVIANDWQCDDLSAIDESHVENLAVITQPPPEDSEV